MLAGECKNQDELNYPGLVSPKLDGIRCIMHPKLGPVSRNLKPIPNKYIRSKLSKLMTPSDISGAPAFDGELIAGDPRKPDTWNTSTSAIMSEAGRPDFTFFVFDVAFMPDPNTVFKRRYAATESLVNIWSDGQPWLQLVRHQLVYNKRQVKLFEDTCLEEGYEGIMWRSLDGPYKQGRSTWREQYLLKIKRFFDTEGTIVGFEEKMHNANVAKSSKLGYTERSSHKANMVPMGTLGALNIRTQNLPNTGMLPTEFNIGTGFDDGQRAEIWRNRKKYLGRTIKFKYQKLSPDGNPIFPVFLGFRED